MRFVACVATNSLFRIENFMNSFIQLKDTEDLYLFVINTGEENLPLENILIKYPRVKRINVGNKPRQYAEVMWEKINAVKDIMNDEDIFINLDDDYAENPWSFKLLKVIYMNHSEVSYLSLLKEETYKNYPRINLSGFDFSKTPTCMGGCLTGKWHKFYNAALEYFNKYGYCNMFDYDFCMHIYNKGDWIYMLQNWSLFAHCNLTSNYLNMKSSKLQHMYGCDTDLFCNPFELIK